MEKNGINYEKFGEAVFNVLMSDDAFSNVAKQDVIGINNFYLNEFKPIQNECKETEIDLIYCFPSQSEDLKEKLNNIKFMEEMISAYVESLNDLSLRKKLEEGIKDNKLTLSKNKNNPRGFKKV